VRGEFGRIEKENYYEDGKRSPGAYEKLGRSADLDVNKSRNHGGDSGGCQGQYGSKNIVLERRRARKPDGKQNQRHYKRNAKHECNDYLHRKQAHPSPSRDLCRRQFVKFYAGIYPNVKIIML
jgi:hypothetical protein